MDLKEGVTVASIAKVREKEESEGVESEEADSQTEENQGE